MRAWLRRRWMILAITALALTVFTAAISANVSVLLHGISGSVK